MYSYDDFECTKSSTVSSLYLSYKFTSVESISFQHLVFMKEMVISDDCFENLGKLSISDLNALESLMIGNRCFYKCTSLTLSDCERLSKVVIGSSSFVKTDLIIGNNPALSLIEIGDLSFSQSTSLILSDISDRENIVIKDRYTRDAKKDESNALSLLTGRDVFQKLSQFHVDDCSGVQTISIPSSNIAVAILSTKAELILNNCTSLKSVSVAGKYIANIKKAAKVNRNCIQIGDLCYNDRVDYQPTHFSTVLSTTSNFLPIMQTKLLFTDKDQSFYFLFGLSSFANASIFAFSYFKNVETITIADNCFQKCEHFLLENCDSLASLVIGSHCFTSSDFSIRHCKALETISISDFSFTRCSSMVFVSCTSLSVFEFGTECFEKVTSGSIESNSKYSNSSNRLQFLPDVAGIH